MNYDEIKRIKEIVEVFEDAEFLSIQSEESLLIRNTKTADIWSVDYSFDAIDGLTLHGESASLEEKAENESEERESDLQKVNGAILMARSDENEEAYSEGLEYLAEAIVASYNSRTKKIRDLKPIVESSELAGQHTDETLAFAKSFANDWNEKLEATTEKFEEVFNAGFLFEGDGSFKYSDIRDPLKLIEAYSIEKENFNEAMDNAELLISFSESLVDMDVPEEVASKIDPRKKNWKIKLTEGLVHAKQEGLFEGKVSAVVSEAEKSHAEIFDEGSPVHLGDEADIGLGSASGEDQMKMLNFGLYNGSNIYSQRDLEKIIKDLSRAESTYIHNGFSREQMSEISGMKNEIDKMYRTAIVSDEEVSKVISNFNSKYGVYKKSVYNPLTNYMAVGA